MVGGFALKQQFSKSYSGLFLIVVIVGNTKAYDGTKGDTSGATDDYDDDNDSCCFVDDTLLAADPFVDFSSYGHIMVVHPQHIPWHILRFSLDRRLIHVMN